MYFKYVALLTGVENGEQSDKRRRRSTEEGLAVASRRDDNRFDHGKKVSKTWEKSIKFKTLFRG